MRKTLEPINQKSQFRRKSTREAPGEREDRRERSGNFTFRLEKVNKSLENEAGKLSEMKRKMQIEEF